MLNETKTCQSVSYLLVIDMIQEYKSVTIKQTNEQRNMEMSTRLRITNSSHISFFIKLNLISEDYIYYIVKFREREKERLSG